jgi:hypothetical protein
MKRTLILAALLVSAASLFAQAADAPCMKEELKPGKDAKMEHFYAATPDKVKQALIDSMKALEFEVSKQSDTDLEAHRSRHFGVMVGSGGEVFVAHLETATVDSVAGTKVSAETKKTFAGRMGQKNWTDAVLARADCILKSGS